MLKLGRLRIHPANRERMSLNFRQELELEKGQICILAGDEENRMKFLLLSLIHICSDMEDKMAFFKEMEIRTLIVGAGAAGYGAAVRLQQYGERDLAILAEEVKAGTSRNTCLLYTSFACIRSAPVSGEQRSSTI